MSYNVLDPYGTYDVKGTSPYEMLMQMKSWNKELRTTISDVQYVLDGTIEKQSQIIQNVDSITQSVLSIDTTVDGINTRVGEIELLADQINLTVTEIDTSLGLAIGQISVLAGAIEMKADTLLVDAIGTRVSSAELIIDSLAGSISSKVSYTDYNGNTIASMINQSATTITLAASKINMVGITEVASSLYVGGPYGGQKREILFGGIQGGARVSAENPNVLDLWAGVGHIAMNSPVDFQSDVNFGNARSVSGLYARFG